MVAPAMDFNKPDVGNPHDTDIDQIRDNTIWSIIAMAVEGMNIPDWNAVPSGADLSKPDNVILTGPGNRKIKIALSYTVDDVTGIITSYDPDGVSGYDVLASGTAVITYNGSGEWTGTTWS